MKNNKEVSIESMSIQTNARATEFAKKMTIELVEKEFARQAAEHSNKIIEEVDSYLEKYRSKNNFDQKIKAIDQARIELYRLERAIRDLGLDEMGGVLNSYQLDKKEITARANAEKLDKKIKEIRKGGSVAQNHKDKIIARIVYATTHGELAVISKQVLGNGVLPVITQKQLEG